MEVRQRMQVTDVTDVTDGIGKKGDFYSFPLLLILSLVDIVLPRSDRTSVLRSTDRPQSMLYSSGIQ
ncbi:MAG: hypothetical protein LH628_03815 [Microcoleus sp. CAN_BIN18]|nr:hypothetical protein [Microcoleus sp. CAN_BIN18]